MSRMVVNGHWGNCREWLSMVTALVPCPLRDINVTTVSFMELGHNHQHDRIIMSGVGLEWNAPRKDVQSLLVISVRYLFYKNIYILMAAIPLNTHLELHPIAHPTWVLSCTRQRPRLSYRSHAYSLYFTPSPKQTNK